jgi:hypothetical protein
MLYIWMLIVFSIGTCAGFVVAAMLKLNHDKCDDCPYAWMRRRDELMEMLTNRMNGSKGGLSVKSEFAAVVVGEPSKGAPEMPALGAVVKGRDMHLIIDGSRYDYNGTHDWEQFSKWFFDSLADHEKKLCEK